MDPVSQLSQSKLHDEKLQIARPNKTKPGTVIGFIVVAIVIAAILTGGYLLLNRKSTPQNNSAQTAVDTSSLTVSVWKPVRTVVNPFTEITVVANKPITLEQNSRVSMHDIGQLDGQYYYVAKAVNLPVDKTDITLKFADEAGNKFEQKIEVTRKPFSFPPGYTQISAWDNSAYVLDGNSLTVTVDKQHRLLEDYEPTDIVDLNKDMGLYTLNNATLRKDAAYALKGMLDELAKETGKYVTVASGYRSYEQQVATYSLNLRSLGETGANNVSAKPGNSQHQLGTTVDFVSDETNWVISNDFGNTAAGQWLAANCSRFGFDLPYKTDTTADSGYIEESWHFRYTGVQPQT